MTNTITGTLVKQGLTATGEGKRGTWVRGGFLLEYGDGDWKRKAYITTHGEDMVADAQAIAEGSRVTVGFAVESREFNDKWYTELRCVSVKSDSQISMGI